MYIKNLVKMLFKSWLVSAALAMIYVGLSDSFGHNAHNSHLLAGDLLRAILVMTSVMWLFVFAGMVVWKNLAKAQKRTMVLVKQKKLQVMLVINTKPKTTFF